MTPSASKGKGRAQPPLEQPDLENELPARTERAVLSSSRAREKSSTKVHVQSPVLPPTVPVKVHPEVPKVLKKAQSDVHQEVPKVPKKVQTELPTSSAKVRRSQSEIPESRRQRSASPSKCSAHCADDKDPDDETFVYRAQGAL